MSAKKTAKPKKKVAKNKARPKAKPAKKAVKKSVKKTAKKKLASKAAKKKTAVKKKVVKKTTKRPVKKKAAVKKKVVKKTTKRPVKKKTAPPKPTAKAKPKKTSTGKPAAKKAPPGASAKAKAASKEKVQAAASPAPAAPTPAPAAKTKKKGRTRRASRRAAIVRRGPDGEILAPGDLLLPGGTKGIEEVQYLFRGCMAAEKPAVETVVDAVLTKRGVPEGPGDRDELQGELTAAQERFGKGDLEPVIPARTNLRRTFEGVVDRARQRRREIGAFLLGLDMGHTETSHMDAHGEASLQSLMEWAARLENLVENLTEAPDANQGHYVQFHRVLDQLEASTEALIIDVEQTLRRLRDRIS